MPPSQRRRSSDTVPPPRRQGKNCDQCRAGKRRCDVQIHTSSGSKTPDSPCTNCTRWRKRCTPDGYFGGVFSGELCFEPDSFGLQSRSAFDPSVYPSSLLDGVNSSGGFGFESDASPMFTAVTDDLGHRGPTEDPLDERNLHIAQGRSFGDPRNRMLDPSDELISPYPTKAVDCIVSHPQISWWAQNQTSQDPWQQDIPDYSSPYRFTPVDRMPSPFTSQLLAEENNRLTVKTGLMKIYHDSMEGALSCWLTERNCPYSSAAFDGSTVWGSDFANRIVTRVCDLDKVYSKTGLLSSRDQQQASRVLNLVVMAFASQWSQTSHRRDAHPSKSPETSQSQRSSETRVDGVDPDDDVFGRNMQKTLWQQANKALCIASENTSFRVILAGIIFSLTQRPIDLGDLQSLHPYQPDHLAMLQTILDHDGPPIVLDVALRKLQDHQRRLEDAESAPTKEFRTLRPSLQLTGIHKQTFGLLYWLAVMFDTLSAAVNHRRFAISDVDSTSVCAEAETAVELSASLDSLHVDVWGAYFLQQHSRSGDVRKHNTRWPCSYNDAASCLADAAPVKVLLFRRVAQLEHLFYNRSSASKVESGIEAALEVYDRWNDTYGRFIDDCIRHHEDLPARIQSWYILLAGHWHLAVLILADLIEKLDDDAQRTIQCNRHKRQSTGCAGTLRTQSAYAVSELGRWARYDDIDSSFSQSPGFHHAVNKAALLTEPWTMVLVRSFGYAGAVWARQVTSEARSVFCGTTTGASERLQYCIDALSLLGKKSGMAMGAAQVLRQAGSRWPATLDTSLEGRMPDLSGMLT
ncbi:hypothetical protein LTR91_014570 [Friedmanniomyces endolithicus]|uniref:Zn(2)-C6 fungal-type domain-containing protein n=1 Tax=Friedmanniomyces endolithicus TaxID=329885 RepID=A0AAN6QPA0_9PEZI|nr:hypothetical protein LTR82_013620 [Friedmanniomyces endolithicus]KAK0911059.1 hypothetical protein LTR57_015594 [Friedmanniomyces endolithicus]KAK0970144.1 hypothetical protein LTS01_015962 [Friedmanniomyces endolithicus]KAK0974024.1 hypothetical protein LTR91_014570 [Friedmanniomyces endolithicus]KAK0979095.1 hypothetical protein LTR54_015763 [Friedmanniomyces endolithicus]